MAVGRITKRSVEAIPLPVGTARNYLWDDQLKGFGCMVTAKAARSYVVQYQMGGRGIRRMSRKMPKPSLGLSCASRRGAVLIVPTN